MSYYQMLTTYRHQLAGNYRKTLQNWGWTVLGVEFPTDPETSFCLGVRFQVVQNVGKFSLGLSDNCVKAPLTGVVEIGFEPRDWARFNGDKNLGFSYSHKIRCEHGYELTGTCITDPWLAQSALRRGFWSHLPCWTPSQGYFRPYTRQEHKDLYWQAFCVKEGREVTQSQAPW